LPRGLPRNHVWNRASAYLAEHRFFTPKMPLESILGGLIGIRPPAHPDAAKPHFHAENPWWPFVQVSAPSAAGWPEAGRGRFQRPTRKPPSADCRRGTESLRRP